MNPFPPIADILPHRGTMLFVDAVTSYSPEVTTCTFRPRADAWYADADGAMPAWLGIEIMAQTIAAHVALTAMTRGEKPKLGALLGSRDYRSNMPSYAAGTPLTITALLELRDASGLGAYECRIEADNSEISSAKLKVYEPDNFEQFLSTGKSAQ